MKKLLSLGIICAIVFLPTTVFSYIKNGVKKISDGISKNNYTVLLCGYDEAGCNTDSIIIANYDKDLSTVSFLQIPRDTYFDFSTGQNKINQYVPEKIKEGKSLHDAMKDFSSELSRALGIKIDGYAGYTMRAVADIIDRFGGIDVNLPVPVNGVDLDGNNVSLDSGVNHLSGAEAVVFLRYRKGYALADLSRIDAHKIFLSALFNKLKTDVKARKIIKLIFSGIDGVVTDINFAEISVFGIKNLSRMKNASVLFSNLVGEHIMADGVSYYALNRDASSELIVHLPFSRISSFDQYSKFLNAEDEAFKDLYYKSGVEYKIISDEDIGELKFNTK